MFLEVVLVNGIWIVLILASLMYGVGTGSLSSINQVIVQVGQQTLEFALPLVAATCFWNGILNVARTAGLLRGLQKLLSPLLKRLFPDLDQDPEALQYIAANIAINVFGLGSAATPSGLKAMECMQRNNPDKKTATRSMVTFLVLNTAGVTLLSTTIITLRAQFGAANPTDFMPFAIMATCCACAAGLLLDRLVNYHDR